MRTLSPSSIVPCFNITVLRTMVKEFVKNNYQNSRDKIVESLKKETEEFSNSDNYDDDILILMLKNI